MGRIRGDEIKFIDSARKIVSIEEVRNFATDYIKNRGGRFRPIPINEIINVMRKELDIVYDIRTLIFFAFFEGIKGEIKEAVHLAKKKSKEPFLMIQGVKGKIKRGYMYGDHTCLNVGETWMGRFRDWKSRREKWDEERKLDLQILDKVLEKVEDYKEREKLKEVKQLYVSTKRRENHKIREEEE